MSDSAVANYTLKIVIYRDQESTGLSRAGNMLWLRDLSWNSQGPLVERLQSYFGQHTFKLPFEGYRIQIYPLSYFKIDLQAKWAKQSARFIIHRGQGPCHLVFGFKEGLASEILKQAREFIKAEFEQYNIRVPPFEVSLLPEFRIEEPSQV